MRIWHWGRDYCTCNERLRQGETCKYWQNNTRFRVALQNLSFGAHSADTVVETSATTRRSCSHVHRCQRESSATGTLIQSGIKPNEVMSFSSRSLPFEQFPLLTKLPSALLRRMILYISTRSSSLKVAAKTSTLLPFGLWFLLPKRRSRLRGARYAGRLAL